MKSYTDLEQSKKLAEILPIETADMCFNISQWHNNMPPLMTPYSKFNEFFNMETPYFLIPCWSLSALLEIIRKATAFNLLIDGRGCRCHCRDKHEGKFYGTDDYCDTPVDACVEIIEKLHEQKLL